MNAWTFYLRTSLIAVLIITFYCMYLLPVNSTEQSFTSECSVEKKLLLLYSLNTGQPRFDKFKQPNIA